MIRLLVAWLVAVAMPLQGLAAGVLPPCAPAAVYADGHAGHGAHVLPTTADSAGQAAAEAASAAPLAHDVLSCCSAGCPIAAVLAPGVVTHAPARPPAPVPMTAGPHEDVVLDGLDRPPRLQRA